jgi:hypothetical protein
LIPVAKDDEGKGEHESLRKGESHAFALSILSPPPLESHPSPAPVAVAAAAAAVAVAAEPWHSPVTASELLLTDDLSAEDSGGKLIQFFREGQDLSLALPSDDQS